MAKYELSEQQVQNLKVLILDADIKGSAATLVAELLTVFDNPVDEVKDRDLHSEHNDGKGHSTDSTEKDRAARH